MHFQFLNICFIFEALALLVTVASGLGYNSNNRYQSIRGNSLNSRGSIGESLFDNGLNICFIFEASLCSIVFYLLKWIQTSEDNLAIS
jgi:hypothetical protein